MMAMRLAMLRQMKVELLVPSASGSACKGKRKARVRSGTRAAAAARALLPARPAPTHLEAGGVEDGKLGLVAVELLALRADEHRVRKHGVPGGLGHDAAAHAVLGVVAGVEVLGKQRGEGEGRVPRGVGSRVPVACPRGRRTMT